MATVEHGEGAKGFLLVQALEVPMSDRSRGVAPTSRKPAQPQRFELHDVAEEVRRHADYATLLSLSRFYRNRGFLFADRLPVVAPWEVGNAAHSHG